MDLVVIWRCPVKLPRGKALGEAAVEGNGLQGDPGQSSATRLRGRNLTSRRRPVLLREMYGGRVKLG